MPTTLGFLSDTFYKEAASDEKGSANEVRLAMYYFGKGDVTEWEKWKKQRPDFFTEERKSQENFLEYFERTKGSRRSSSCLWNFFAANQLCQDPRVLKEVNDIWVVNYLIGFWTFGRKYEDVSRTTLHVDELDYPVVEIGGTATMRLGDLGLREYICIAGSDQEGVFPAVTLQRLCCLKEVFPTDWEVKV